MNRRVAFIGSILLVAAVGAAVAVAKSARGAWWLNWKDGGSDGVVTPGGPVPHDLLDRLAKDREHVQIVIGGRLLAQITGCG